MFGTYHIQTLRAEPLFISFHCGFGIAVPTLRDQGCLSQCCAVEWGVELHWVAGRTVGWG